MLDDLINKLILKHFENFELGMEGKYHNVGFEDLRGLVKDVLEHCPAPVLPARLEIASRVIAGVLANPSGVKGQRAVVDFTLSMTDDLIRTHRDTFGEAKDASTP